MTRFAQNKKIILNTLEKYINNKKHCFKFILIVESYYIMHYFDTKLSFLKHFYERAKI